MIARTVVFKFIGNDIEDVREVFARAANPLKHLCRIEKTKNGDFELTATENFASQTWQSESALVILAQQLCDKVDELLRKDGKLYTIENSKNVISGRRRFDLNFAIY